MINLENPLNDVILAREVQVWNALVCADADADAALLGDDFVGVYADGIARKHDHIGQLRDGPTIASFSIQQSQLIQLGPDHCLLTYQVEFWRVAAVAIEAMFVSSVWAFRGKDWVNIFSQDTAAVPA